MKRYSKNKNRSKNRTRNKSIKNRNQLQIVSVNYYSKNFKNTQLIPKTEIVNYMFSGFNDYLLHKKLCDALGVYTLSLEQCFIINNDDMPNGLRSNTISLSLQMNPEMSLDKLIAYSFYLKQLYIFENKNGISEIKNQIGKDIKRSERTINGKLYDGMYYAKFEDNYSAADIFYQNIIDQLYTINGKNVNLNIANKFAFLSCQNVFNLITDLITLKLNKILEPEMNSVFRPDKFINIIINPNEISMELTFISDLIISRDQEPIDPEYPCGKIDFSLYIDMLNNKYELKKFILSYDIDKCGPEKILKVNNLKDKVTKKSNIKPEYIIPASIVTAGLISTPILLTTLGGRKTKKRRIYK